MKRIKFIICFFSVALATIAQTSTENYILSRTYTSEATGYSATYMDQIQYFDGLGRPIQTVQKGITPGTTHYDLVTYTEYDGAGRVSKQWLPIVSSGGFVNLSSFSQGSTLYNNDTHACTETHYEASPLNRVDWQQGPGAAWIKNRTLTAYDTNLNNEVKCFTVSGASLINTGYYDPATLYKTTVTDEDGNPATEYKDKLGRVVMKRGFTDKDGNHDTYYVYNDLGQLCFVLPPYAADASGSADAVNKYGYVYRYDARGNCTYKKLPGCEPINMTYYTNDLLETSQDGNQYAKNEKLKYVYDGLNRLVSTSLEVNSVSTVLTENYYDNYGFTATQPNLVFVANAGYDAQYSSAKGLLTGTRTRILDNSNTYIYTAIYYDYRGLPVQTRSTNHLGGYDYVYNAYKFTGQVSKNLKVHSIQGQAAINELYLYGYDHAGRLDTVTYQLNDKTPVVLALNTYDDLGRLVAKKRHNGADNEAFEYNLRNWPTKITSGAFVENLYYNKDIPSGGTACYNGNIAASTWKYKNVIDGYIHKYDELNRLKSSSSILYSLSSENNHYEYFDYDKHGNIKGLFRMGNYGDLDNLRYDHNGNQVTSIFDDAGSFNMYSVKEYNEKNVDMENSTVEFFYDANGNLIKDLDRDILGIKYNYLNLPEVIQFKGGNQIRNLYDAAGQKLNTRYVVLYCEIEVPINTTNNNVMDLDDLISYTEETYIDGTDYIGNIEWTYSGCFFDFGGYNEEWSLGRISNSEGYINSTNTITYYYTRKDHLGSIREVWTPAYTTRSVKGLNFHPATTVHYTQYYPSGLPFASNPGDNPYYPYKYNGKEFIEMNGYDTYDYGARGYYPAIGRFTSVDPLAEKHPEISPYVYCAGNPVRYVDPDGRDFIVLSMNNGNQELRRIKMDGEDRYYKVNEDAFNKASKSFTNDNLDYNTMLSIGSLRTQERNSDQTGLIAEQTGVGVSVSGSMRDGNNLIGDVQVTFQANFDDNSNYAISSYNAVAGGYGNGAPENGDYTVNNYQDRSPSGWYSSGMNRDGVGFSYNLNPQFNTGRSDLRVHPDGNNEGTLGCIGLTGNAQAITDFRNTLNGYLQNRSSLPVNINITNNPNNNGRNGTRIPHVRE